MRNDAAVASAAVAVKVVVLSRWALGEVGGYL